MLSPYVVANFRKLIFCLLFDLCNQIRNRNEWPLTKSIHNNILRPDRHLYVDLFISRFPLHPLFGKL